MDLWFDSEMFSEQMKRLREGSAVSEEGERKMTFWVWVLALSLLGIVSAWAARIGLPMFPFIF